MSGDRITAENFNELLENNPDELFGRIYHIAELISYRFLRRKDDDAIQEAVLRVWEKRHKIKDKNPFGYIYLMVKNRLVQFSERDYKKSNTFLDISMKNAGFACFS